MTNDLSRIGPCTACTLLRLWLEGEMTLNRAEVHQLMLVIKDELDAVEERVVWNDGWIQIEPKE